MNNQDNTLTIHQNLIKNIIQSNPSNKSRKPSINPPNPYILKDKSIKNIMNF
jgi:hypothetical protein